MLRAALRSIAAPSFASPIAPLRGAVIAAAAPPPSLSTTMEFIDIGANLLDPMYAGLYHGGATPAHPPDLPAVLDRAWAAGLRRIIITAGNLEESVAALALARTHPRLHCTVGVHPTRCGEIEAYTAGPEAYIAELQEVIRDGAADGKVVAVGECGLDYERLQFCDAPTQRRWFEAQFALAAASGLPMFLHLRGGSGEGGGGPAAGDFLEIVGRQVNAFPAGVVHSFDGTHEEMTAILGVDKLDIGLNGCSLRTEANLAVAAAVPAGRLHLETDAPWCDVRASHAGASFVRTKLAAKDKKKQDPGALVKGRNEPANIRQVFEVVAGARGMGDCCSDDAVALAAQVLRNTEAVYFGGTR